MYFADEITLRSVPKSVVDGFNVGGEPVDTVVFGDKKSVARTEFFAARAAGVKTDTVFEIRAFDYDGQTRVLHNGVEYDVVRSYQTGPNVMELTCARR